MAARKPSNNTKSKANNVSDSNRSKSASRTSKKNTPAKPRHVALTEAYLAGQIRDNWPDLDDKERAFADAYIENGYDHREAAESIGRKAKAGKALTRRPLIRAYINHMMDELRISSLVTKDFIDAKLDDLYNMAMGHEEVPIVLADGQAIDRNKFDGRLALNILQERSKINGLTGPLDDDNPLSSFVSLLRDSLTK